MQLQVLPMDGGEPRQITGGTEPVRFYGWGPDGRSVVYGRPDGEEKREGVERHNRSFEVGASSYLTRSGARPVHLWRIPVDGGEAVRLTEGMKSVVDFEWAREGGALVMVVRPSAHSGAEFSTSLELLNLVTGGRRTLVPEGTFAGRLKISPNGNLISFHQHRRGETGFVPLGVFTVARDGGDPRDITAGIDRSLQSTVWLPDGSGILVHGPDRTTVSIWVQPLDGPARRLELQAVEPISALVTSDAGRIAFVGKEPHRPPELYVMDAPEWKPRRMTNFNREVASRQMGRVESVVWPGPDGFEMTGVLIYPPGYHEGRKYPLVLNIHGGPGITSTEGFSPVGQIFAAQGWLVFQPNYRGSNNQGEAFQSAFVNDTGDGPGRDIMSGFELLTGRGIVDESRIAVSGWSMGGFMTVWLTAHYDGWAAAVAGAPVTDWFDQYAASDQNTLFGFALGGSPWLNDNAENYRRQSPISHAHRIRTPTLILSTTGDERVPVSNSYKLFHALKDNGVEVKFVAYPVSGHFPFDPVHTQDVYHRWIDWIDRHFDRQNTR
jgi:dipeptidyl aminopeptidase/acylaminoacyl peptidase